MSKIRFRTIITTILLLGITTLLIPIKQVTLATPNYFDVRLVNDVEVAGLNLPTAIHFDDTLPGFLVAEKEGRIIHWSGNDSDLGDTTEIIDFGPNGHNVVHSHTDRGLLGLVTDPEFNNPISAGYRVVYVFYSSRDRPPHLPATELLFNECQSTNPLEAECAVQGHLSRFQIPETIDGLDAAITEYEVVKSDWCFESVVHSTGDLVIAGEQMFISAGDGIGSTANELNWNQPINECNDLPGLGGTFRAQSYWLNPNGTPSLGGSVVALALTDVRTKSDVDAVPHQFLSGGERNPWRMAYDQQSGDLFVGNVGWSSFEEINRVPSPVLAGNEVPANFGWPCKEGSSLKFDYNNLGDSQCSAVESFFVDPWFNYSASDPVADSEECRNGRSISSLVSLNTDLGSGFGQGLFASDYVSGCGWLFENRSDSGALLSSNPRLVSDQLSGIVDAVQHPDTGDIYWLSIWGPEGGTVNRLGTGVAAKVAANYTATVGGTATLDASTSETSLNNTNLIFDWDLDGDGDFNDAYGPKIEVSNVVSTQIAAVRVTDLIGRIDIAQVTYGVGSQPSVTITANQEPQLSSGEYLNGSTVDLTATVIDDESFPTDQISWQATIEHCGTPQTCHSHFLKAGSGATISLNLEPHEDNSFVKVFARATDKTGLTGENYIDLKVSHMSSIEPPIVLGKVLRATKKVLKPWDKIEIDIQFSEDVVVQQSEVGVPSLLASLNKQSLVFTFAKQKQSNVLSFVYQGWIPRGGYQINQRTLKAGERQNWDLIRGVQSGLQPSMDRVLPLTDRRYQAAKDLISQPIHKRIALKNTSKKIFDDMQFAQLRDRSIAWLIRLPRKLHNNTEYELLIRNRRTKEIRRSKFNARSNSPDRTFRGVFRGLGRGPYEVTLRQKNQKTTDRWRSEAVVVHS